MFKPLFCVTVYGITAVNAFAENNEDNIAVIKSYPAIVEKQAAIFNTGFDTPEFEAAKLPKGYALKKGEGLNGTAALFYERTDPNEYVLYSLPIKGLIAGQHYIIKAHIETYEGLA